MASSPTFAILPFALLRTPLLPWKPEILTHSLDELAQAYSQQLLQEALYIASPDLYRSWQHMSAHSDNSRGTRKIQLALYKYLVRMSYRCTPFGLFAGVSPVRFAERTTLHLAGAEDGTRVCRADMRYLIELARHLESEYPAREQLRYRPNPTLYRVGSQYRYVENTATRGYQLVRVEASAALTSVLSCSAGRPDDFAAAIDEEDITPAEALEFVHEIIDAQLLIGLTAPSLTGPDYLQRLLDQWPKPAALDNPLRQLGALVAQVNAQPIGAALPAYEALTAWSTTQLPDGAQGPVAQTDYQRTLVADQLHHHVARELTQTVDLLARLPQPVVASNMDTFRAAFLARYEEREVPLLEVLDPEIGLGYPITAQPEADNALLAGIPLPPAAAPAPATTDSRWQEFLLGQYAAALHQQQTVIRLDAVQCMPYVQPQALNLPYSLSSYATVLASSPGAVDAGDFELVHHVTSGPSAANLMARFAYLSDELTEHLQQALAEEQQHYPTAILADVIHAGRGQTANVMRRPRLRPYELPLLATAAVEDDYVIALQDLMVSVQHGRVVLRCQRRDVEIISRLSSAHTYASEGLPVYTFLGDLQYHGYRKGLKWRWGDLEQAPFLPRVMVGRTIVAKARWQLQATQLHALRTAAQLLPAMQSLRAELRLPRHVTLLDGEAELPLDLEAEASLLLLQSLVPPAGPLILQESLVLSEQWVQDDEGSSYTNELIFPLRNLAFTPPKPIARRPPTATTQRRFLPGSRWLYVKIYCGPTTADQLLTEAIGPLATRLLAADTEQQWFFLRYQDPEPHLRVRFLVAENQVGATLDAVFNAVRPYEATGVVSAVQLDTYSRELERYGTDNIDDTETLFFHHSALTVELLRQLGQDEQTDPAIPRHWLTAFYCVEQLLTSFGFDARRKLRVVDVWQQQFKQEFQVDHPAARKQFAAKFRLERPVLQALLAAEPPAWFAPYQVCVAESFATQQPVVARITARVGPARLESLVASYAHMFLNRFFPSQQRRCELALYDLLHQYYLAARGRTHHAPTAVALEAYGTAAGASDGLFSPA